MKIIIPFILFLVSFAAIGQRQTTPDFNKFLPHFISLPAIETKINPSFPVSTIEVYDARFDTSNIGLIQKPAGSREKMVRFKHGTTGEIREFYRSLIKTDTLQDINKPMSIVCFIKKLFLSDKIYVDGTNKVSSNDPVYEVKSGGMVTLEFYARQNDIFLPLYRFDTTVAGDKDVFHEGRNYMTIILSASLRKIESVKLEKIKASGKPRSRFEIDSFNNARLSIPILNENPRKGIYLNFENFRNNNPIDSPFTVDNGSRGDFLYVKNKKGDDILQTEIWGYSDGKKSYIHSAENFFELTRHNNTFRVYGAKDFSSSRKLRLNFGLLDAAIPNSNYAKAKTYNTYNLVLNFFLLDMESGELY